MASPFNRINMLVMAVNAAISAHAASVNLADKITLGAAMGTAFDALNSYKSRGHGGKKPRHSSKRFVAQDKRDAKKRRNRRRR